MSGLEYFLKCEVKNIFDTKICSKLVRTYTANHGLKDLVQEFCGKKLDKRLGSSDWNKNLDELTDAQLQYCNNDVIYLHKIKNELPTNIKIYQSYDTSLFVSEALKEVIFTLCFAISLFKSFPYSDGCLGIKGAPKHEEKVASGSVTPFSVPATLAV